MISGTGLVTVTGVTVGRVATALPVNVVEPGAASTGISIVTITSVVEVDALTGTWSWISEPPTVWTAGVTAVPEIVWEPVTNPVRAAVMVAVATRPTVTPVTVTRPVPLIATLCPTPALPLQVYAAS